MEDIFNRIKFKDVIEVEKAWNTSLPAELLDTNFEEDQELYETDKEKLAFLTRRFATLRYFHCHDWEREVSMACWEIIKSENGKFTEKFHRKGLYDSLHDFIQHIFYFEVVRNLMLKQQKVVILGEKSSTIHDIDKLHPIMLAGYAEKFQDSKDTSLWKACVGHHIEINPHHQDNELWHEGNCPTYNTPKDHCSHCEELRNFALSEMICDKVSRKLQKDLGGTVCEEMWDVNPSYFKGLPEPWLEKAYKIIDECKKCSATQCV